jgi:hypothetical protein
MTEDFDRKRRFPRVKTEYPALVKRVDPEEFAGLGTARTMGLGGCMVEQEISIGEGNPVEVRFSVAGRIIAARGVVVYEKPMPGSKTFEIGIEFLLVPREDLAIIQKITHTGPEI